jgi:formylglycine-generating enzyme required for sulfatase activity
LLRFLVTAEGQTENSLYARALKLWRTILEKTASSLVANSPAQHRLALDVALLNLWDQPAEAAFALHRLTGAGLEPEIRREVCAYGLPHCTPPVIALPWAWQELNQNPQAQQILFQLGLQGIQEQITGIRRPARFPLVLAVLAILTVGAALRAWKPEKDTGAPTLQQMNAPPGAQAWAERSGATYRVVAQHEKTRAEVQSPARARVTVRWVEKKQEEKTELADWCPYQETTDHGIVFVRVCAGEFTMGSAEEDQEAHPSEKPAHRVKLPEFWIGKYEVSNAQYRKHDLLHKSLSDGPEQPVNGITWTEARQFCESQGFRLPTEAEWEYAARGRDGRKYPWGDDPPTRSRAVYEVPGALGNPTSPSVVTSHSEGKGPFGTLHQAGNVWEWMEDCYESGGYLQQLDNHRDKENGDSPVVSPVYWVKNCEHHTLRGGSFWDEPWDLRSAGRRRRGSANQHERIGFRCVRAGSQ